MYWVHHKTFMNQVRFCPRRINVELSVYVTVWLLCPLMNSYWTSTFCAAYVLLRTVTKDEEKSEVKPDRSSSSTSSSVAPAASVMPFTPPIVPPDQRPPIPEDQQRELFKWLLEEKRKVKAKDAEEKKCIDEEKAILKQFIRAKSLPSIWLIFTTQKNHLLVFLEFVSELKLFFFLFYGTIISC